MIYRNFPIFYYLFNHSFLFRFVFSEKCDVKLIVLGNSLINEMLEVIAVFYLQKQPPEMFYKKGVLEISQNSQENTCVRASFLIKLQASGLRLY